MGVEFQWIGTKMKGKVRNLTAYGAFVELEEGIDGMIHVSDLSWTRKINHPSEILKKGQEVEATIRRVIAESAALCPGITVEIKRLLLANSMRPLPGNKPLVDAIEVFNARCLYAADNARARRNSGPA